eukprot:m.50382 g.50382  ORF g.50382 m.50382 type:complete len:331 (-) comp10666_c0_seq2:843-1835(-)
MSTILKKPWIKKAVVSAFQKNLSNALHNKRVFRPLAQILSFQSHSSFPGVAAVGRLSDGFLWIFTIFKTSAETSLTDDKDVNLSLSECRGGIISLSNYEIVPSQPVVSIVIHDFEFVGSEGCLAFGDPCDCMLNKDVILAMQSSLHIRQKEELQNVEGIRHIQSSELNRSYLISYSQSKELEKEDGPRNRSSIQCTDFAKPSGTSPAEPPIEKTRHSQQYSKEEIKGQSPVLMLDDDTQRLLKRNQNEKALLKCMHNLVTTPILSKPKFKVGKPKRTGLSIRRMPKQRGQFDRSTHHVCEPFRLLYPVTKQELVTTVGNYFAELEVNNIS